MSDLFIYSYQLSLLTNKRYEVFDEWLKNNAEKNYNISDLDLSLTKRYFVISFKSAKDAAIFKVFFSDEMFI